MTQECPHNVRRCHYNNATCGMIMFLEIIFSQQENLTNFAHKLHKCRTNFPLHWIAFGFITVNKTHNQYTTKILEIYYLKWINKYPTPASGCPKTVINSRSKIREIPQDFRWRRSGEEDQVKKMLLLTALIIAALSPYASSRETWKNGWDGRLDFSCPSKQHISWVQSIHDNHREDRRWDYGWEN